MGQDLLGGLCVCWLLPLALLAGVVLTVNALGVARRSRGLERGEVYCSECRFSLHGCASWNCPECGAHLDEGRVMTPGEDRPLGLVPRLLLMVLGASGPLVLLGVLLAVVVPVNYETRRVLELSPNTESVFTQSRVDLHGYGEVAWFGRGRPQEMILRVAWTQQYSGHRWDSYRYEPPLAESDEALLTDRVWGRLVEQCGLEQESAAWHNAARGEMVLALRYMAAEMDERPTLAHYHVQENTRPRFEPDGLFVLIEFMLGVVAMGLVVRWTVRWHGRVMDVYLHRHARLSDRVNGWIARNREQAGLGKE